MTKPGLPTKTRVPGHKPSSLPRVDRNRARVFPRVVADTGPSTWARSSHSFLSVAREGKGLARCSAFATSGSGALQRWGRCLHTANVVSVCVFVTDICGLRPGQLLQGAGRGATAFYTSSVDAWCSLEPNGAFNELDKGAQGTMDEPNRPGQRAQDLRCPKVTGTH
jgi:hypothetical protein